MKNKLGQRTGWKQYEFLLLDSFMLFCFVAFTFFLNITASDILTIPILGPIDLFIILAHAGDLVQLEADSKALCMEDQLRSLGILDTSNSPLDSIVLDGINLEANVPPKKVCFLSIKNTKSNVYDSKCLYFIFK